MIRLQFYWGRNITFDKFFTEGFVKEVHRKMYSDVWKWAGEFRKTNKNIGVDKWEVSTELKYLLDDAHYWVKNDVYSPDEIAIRLKHCLVSIHCFPNGNGRHSRLMADLLIFRVYKKAEPFSWGAAELAKKDATREPYLNALKSADKGDVNPLIQFARS
ncbi:mobile mystery protein B [Asinibacterium sp. OR53]|uniref:mobile mystery protein B n=1 Tax=Asinibacterium sp. OR53 TaxID=925409 RepID=UPI0006847C3B|nr:mobile mystery protein B [Asinibacterium sp. OR53]